MVKNCTHFRHFKACHWLLTSFKTRKTKEMFLKIQCVYFSASKNFACVFFFVCWTHVTWQWLKDLQMVWWSSHIHSKGKRPGESKSEIRKNKYQRYLKKKLWIKDNYVTCSSTKFGLEPWGLLSADDLKELNHFHNCL